jgi:hypothetical protein
MLKAYAVYLNNGKIALAIGPHESAAIAMVTDMFHDTDIKIEFTQRCIGIRHLLPDENRRLKVPDRRYPTSVGHSSEWRTPDLSQEIELSVLSELDIDEFEWVLIQHSHVNVLVDDRVHTEITMQIIADETGFHYIFKLTDDPHEYTLPELYCHFREVEYTPSAPETIADLMILGVASSSKDLINTRRLFRELCEYVDTEMGMCRGDTIEQTLEQYQKHLNENIASMTTYELLKAMIRFEPGLLSQVEDTWTEILTVLPILHDVRNQTLEFTQ